MTIPETNEIADTGLRYKAKAAGSPFAGMGAPGEIRSCMQCGQHMPRNKGAIHRLMHSLMFFCYACRPQRSAPHP